MECRSLYIGCVKSTYVRMIYTDGYTWRCRGGLYTWRIGSSGRCSNGKGLNTGQGGLQMETGYAMRYPLGDEVVQRDKDIHGDDVIKKDEDLYGDFENPFHLKVSHLSAYLPPQGLPTLVRVYPPAPFVCIPLVAPLLVQCRSIIPPPCITHLAPCIPSSVVYTLVSKKVRVVLLTLSGCNL